MNKSSKLLACPDDLVNEHWDYIEKVLENYAGKPMYLHMIEFHYKTAFKHGWKHAIQEKAGLRATREEGDVTVDELTDYAYKDLDEYEKIVGFETNESFRIGWTMARITNKQLKIPTDTERLDWLEEQYGLHREVEITYVVDGYEIEFTHDGNPTDGKRYHGRTLHEAIDAAKRGQLDK